MTGLCGAFGTWFAQLRRYQSLSLHPQHAQLTVLDQDREKQKNFEVDFSLLQEISRHSFHVGEVLTVTMGTTEEMRQWRQALLPAISGKQDKQQLDRDKTNSYLSFQTQILKSFKLRQQSNQDRLQAEITLVFLSHY
jgi:hypothetical protein